MKGVRPNVTSAVALELLRSLVSKHVLETSKRALPTQSNRREIRQHWVVKRPGEVDHVVVAPARDPIASITIRS